MKNPRIRIWLGTLIAIAHAVQVMADAPAWWGQRGVVSGAPSNDYAVANVGQLKHIATLAYDEMQATLSGGAGPALTSLITTWSQPPAQGVVRNDYAAINIGQLKTVAKLFYDRLAELSYQGPPLASGQIYPWTSTIADDNDYAAANIGQVKLLFSFDLTSVAVDTDSDGLPDPWEIQHFGDLSQSATADPDSDGLTNLQELQLTTNPNSGDTNGNGLSDALEDRDSDGLSNIQEFQLGTNPNNADTDGDGLPDGWENGYGLNPLASSAAADPDNDGLSNVQEFQLGRNPGKGAVGDTSGVVNLRVYSPSR